MEAAEENRDNAVSGGRTLTLQGSGIYSFGGQINNGSGTTGITMQGTGTQTLYGANNFDSGLTLSSGTLILNFNLSGAPASNIVSSTDAPASFSMGSGTLSLNGNSTTSNSQTLSKLTLPGGEASIQLTGNGQSLMLNFGNIQTQTAGSTINFTLPTGTQSASNGILSTVGNDSGGIIGGYATVGGTDWAVLGAGSSAAVPYTASVGSPYVFTEDLANGTAISFNNGVPTGSGLNGGQLFYVVDSNGTTFEIATTVGGTPSNSTTNESSNVGVYTQGNITALSSYATFVGTNGSSTSNYLLAGSGTVSTTNESFNSLKITTTGSGNSLNLGGESLTLTSGGLLFTGTNNYSITNGDLKSGTSSPSQFIVQQYGTGDLTIGAVIQNGSGASTLTVSGTGTLTLTAANTFTGATYLNGGVVNFNALGALGTGSNIYFDGGTLQYATGNTVDISGRTVTINPGGATIDTNGNHVIFASGIGNSGIGGLTLNDTNGSPGSLTLEGTNTYTGATTVSAGTLDITGSLAAGSAVTVSNNAKLEVNGTVGGTVALGNGATLGSTSTGATASMGALTIGSSGDVINLQNTMPQLS